MQTNHAGQLPNAIPGWVKLGAVGVVTLALSQFAPAGPHPIPAVAGVLMVLAALVRGRLWVADLKAAEAKPPPSPR